jgi:hypothetical protein
VHASLVAELVTFVNALAKDRVGSIYADLPGSSAESKPPPIGGYVPDVLANHPGLIIGEAKTKTDLDTRHSREQLCAFLSHLAQHKDGLLVLAVPLHAWNYGKSVIRAAKLHTNSTEVRSICIFPQYRLLSEDSQPLSSALRL